MKFKEYKLSDVVQIIGGGTPKRSVAEYWNGEIPWISIKDFSSTKRINFTQEAITSLGLQKSSSKILDKDDIVISARGTVGLVAQLGKPMAFNQSCYGLKAREMAINDFLYYWLKQNVTYVKANTHGSVFDTITKDTFNNLLIKLPSLKKQKKIVSILDSIDSKIEINNQIISNLEELASTLFKRWFVDFEFPDENGNPYKSSGGKMVDSELGEIPEGWEINPLSSIAKITSGKRPDVKKTNPDKDNIIPIVGASKIMGYTNQVLENGSIITTGRVGTHGIIQRYREKVWVSDNSFIIKSDTEEFLNQILLRIDYKNLNRGSTQPLITQTDLKKYKIVLPSSKFIEMFESVISKLTECEFQIKKQNLNLEKIRDSLLPKLLSGEIELPEDEEV